MVYWLSKTLFFFKWCCFNWCFFSKRSATLDSSDGFHLFGRQNTEAFSPSGGLRWLTGWCEPPLAQCCSFAHDFIGKIDENAYPWRFCAKQKRPVQYVFVGLPKFQAFLGISGDSDITEDRFFD